MQNLLTGRILFRLQRKEVGLSNERTGHFDDKVSVLVDHVHVQVDEAARALVVHSKLFIFL